MRRHRLGQVAAITVAPPGLSPCPARAAGFGAPGVSPPETVAPRLPPAIPASWSRPARRALERPVAVPVGDEFLGNALRVRAHVSHWQELIVVVLVKELGLWQGDHPKCALADPRLQGRPWRAARGGPQALKRFEAVEGISLVPFCSREEERGGRGSASFSFLLSCSALPCDDAMRCDAMRRDDTMRRDAILCDAVLEAVRDSDSG